MVTEGGLPSVALMFSGSEGKKAKSYNAAMLKRRKRAADRSSTVNFL